MSALPPEFLGPPLAHRGFHDIASGIPENSRAAVRAAIAQGYGIEIDVQMTSDGEAMVFHDHALQRLTLEHGMVRDRSSADLGKVRLKESDERIPSLREILAEVNGRVPVLIEIKDQTGAMSRDVGPLESAVADALRGYAGPVAVMSFNPHSVIAFGGHASGIPRGLTTCDFRSDDWPGLPPDAFTDLRDIPLFDAAGAGFISHSARDLANPRVVKLKSQGVPILCWTIRSQIEEDAARHVADNITFEGYPARLP